MKTISSALFILLCAFSCFCSFPTKVNGQAVTIYYEKEAYSGIIGDAQVEILSAPNLRILIDVAKPSSLLKPVTPQDILLTTHLHSDHFNWAFAQSFPGKQLRMEKGEITISGLKIKSIAASHSTLLPREVGGGDNYIYVIDIGNLRITHFGDTEQLNLTQEQLEELGKVDVAFIEFWIDPSNKYFNIMDQVRPRLVMPTHLGGSDAVEHAIQKWPSFKREARSVEITSDCLPVETTFLLLGQWAKEYSKTFDLEEWECN